VLRALETRPGVRVQHVDGRLNDAPLINRAVKKARGEILVLLSHGIEIRDPAWLTEMVPFALQREVGVVGAKLIHPDGSLHHGGLVLRPDGPAGQVLPFAPPDEPGYFGQLALARSLSAVSAACMVMRREVFEEVGGFDEDLAVASSEVDLCLRLRDLGYRVVWTPDAVLTYRESSMCPDQEHDPVPRRSRALEEDPYYNPNLLLHRAGGPLIPAPPRRQKPWRRLAAA
jgi:GT2 family glycosyltransferase